MKLTPVPLWNCSILPNLCPIHNFFAPFAKCCPSKQSFSSHFLGHKVDKITPLCQKRTRKPKVWNWPCHLRCRTCGCAITWRNWITMSKEKTLRIWMGRLESLPRNFCLFIDFLPFLPSSVLVSTFKNLPRQFIVYFFDLLWSEEQINHILYSILCFLSIKMLWHRS